MTKSKSLSNENLSFEFVKKHISECKLLSRKFISIDFIIDYCQNHEISLEDWNKISQNPNWDFTDKKTLDFIEKHADELNWDYFWNLENNNLTVEFLKKYSNRNWSWSILSCNNPFVQDVIEELFLKKALANPDNDALWHDISRNPILSEKMMDQYPHLLIWEKISRNHQITFRFIKKYEKRLYWDKMSFNKTLTPEIIWKYVQKWNWYKLSQNVSLTIDLIEKYINRIEWEPLSWNPNLTLEIIEKYIDKWNWSNLSNNDYLNIDIVRKYYNKLDYSLVLNHNLDFELIEKIYQDYPKHIIKTLFFNQLNLDPITLARNKKKYSQALLAELLQELSRREMRRNKNIFDLCIHEIKLNIRDTKNGTLFN